MVEKQETNRNIYTMGYEGIKIENFIEKIKSNNIKIIIDVRDYPKSRKRGFSKSQLEKILKDRHILYFHFKELGTPIELRKYLKKYNDFKRFKKDFKKLLADKEGDIKKLIYLARESSICLMCFERKADTCHRSLIVDEINKNSNNFFNIINL